MNLSEVRTGWAFTRTVRNNASTNPWNARQSAVTEIPYPVTCLGFDNGTGF